MRVARALAAIGIILSTLAILCFAANVALTLRTMSRGLDETNAHLAQMNQLLWGTNARLDSTKAQIRQTNARLERITGDVRQTNVRLDESNRTLWGMATDIHAMEEHVVRAKRSP